MALTDFFYAVLALDSYNRGPNPGVVGLGGAGSTIGSATILNVPVPLGSADANFYTVAYQDFPNNIVIAYRGTDDPRGENAKIAANARKCSARFTSSPHSASPA